MKISPALLSDEYIQKIRSDVEQHVTAVSGEIEIQRCANLLGHISALEIAYASTPRRAAAPTTRETGGSLSADAAHVKTMEAGDALESAARSFERHSGPGSTNRERALFGQDLRAAAMRYARAYYAEARAYGLIPEVDRG